QMRISEQAFINGKIDIISLSLERGRRSAAIVSYQEGKAALQNAITRLEMLTNVKIMNR
ncbi:MAG: TolC family protein, partial [Bacteroidales bacterium]